MISFVVGHVTTVAHWYQQSLIHYNNHHRSPWSSCFQPPYLFIVSHQHNPSNQYSSVKIPDRKPPRIMTSINAHHKSTRMKVQNCIIKTLNRVIARRTKEPTNPKSHNGSSKSFHPNRNKDLEITNINNDTTISYFWFVIRGFRQFVFKAQVGSWFSLLMMHSWWCEIWCVTVVMKSKASQW